MALKWFNVCLEQFCGIFQILTSIVSAFVSAFDIYLNYYERNSYIQCLSAVNHVNKPNVSQSALFLYYSRGL